MFFHICIFVQKIPGNCVYDKVSLNISSNNIPSLHSVKKYISIFRFQNKHNYPLFRI